MRGSASGSMALFFCVGVVWWGGVEWGLEREVFAEVSCWLAGGLGMR